MPVEFLECWIEKTLWLGLARTSWWSSAGRHGCRWGIRSTRAGYLHPFITSHFRKKICYIWAFIISTLRNPEMMSSHKIPQTHTPLSKTTPAHFAEKCLGAQNNAMSQCISLLMCPWQVWLSIIPTGAFAADLEPAPKSQLLPVWLSHWLHSRWPAYGKGGLLLLGTQGE